MTVPALKEDTAIVALSRKWGIDPEGLLSVVKSSIFRGEASRVTDHELIGFLLVCNTHNLNPILREIYAFPGRQGGVIPIVGIDGWVSLVNRNKRYNGVDFVDHVDDKGNMGAITCRIYVKGMERSVEVTEYMAECKRNTEPWNKWPRRMLRHKAYIQCARVAFGLSGIYDEDEAQRILEAEDVTYIQEPMTVEQAKSLVLPPPEPPQAQEEVQDIPEEPPDVPKRPPPEGKGSAMAATTPPPPKGEEVVSPEKRQEVIKHLQDILVRDMPPPDMTEIEAGQLLECKRSDKANRLLDAFALGRDKQREMLT